MLASCCACYHCLNFLCSATDFASYSCLYLLLMLLMPAAVYVLTCTCWGLYLQLLIFVTACAYWCLCWLLLLVAAAPDVLSCKVCGAWSQECKYFRIIHKNIYMNLKALLLLWRNYWNLGDTYIVHPAMHLDRYYCQCWLCTTFNLTFLVLQPQHNYATYNIETS